MKKNLLPRCIAIVAIIMLSSVTASALTAIAPYGQLANETWSAKYFYALIDDGAPVDDWYTADFDDSAWSNIAGPISLAEPYSSYPPLDVIGTTWAANKSSYWLRRHFTVTDTNFDNLVFYVIHDDICTAYLNGVQIYNSTSAMTYPNYTTISLTGDAKAALKKGDNVLAVFVSDTGGGMALVDFGLYGQELKDMVTSTDVPLTFTNDATYPWTVSGTEAQNGNKGVSNSISTLTMEYTSTYRTELKFDWYEYNYSQHQPLQLYIDGVQTSSTNNSSWTTPRFYLEPGTHVIVFRDQIGNNSNINNRSGIRNLSVKEIKPLETAVLTANSMPLTFTNNSATPWTIQEGCVEHGNWCKQKVGATFSTTFTVEKTSKLSFKYKVANYNYDNSYNYEGAHSLFVKVNGIQITKAWNNINDTYWCLALEPGKYTVEWTDTVYTDYADWINYYSQVKEIELSNNWIDVDLATAGTLGYEVLYTEKASVLTDVEFLKVSGPLNAADWTDIKNMTNLKALDLSGAQITELPNTVFDGKTLLSSVILPEGLKTIGEYAFRGTTIRKMHVPSTVTTIGQRAFESTPLQYLTFANNSQMNTIGVYAFNNCTSLQSVDFGNNSQLTTISERAFSSCTAMKSVNFGNNSVLTTIGRGAFAWCYALANVQMPNTVTEVSYGAFQSCTALKSIVFSDAMTVIRDHVCYGCSALEEVHLPVALEGIYMRSFVGTTSLKEIDIPATVNEIRAQAFENSGIESIKLPITMQYLYRYAFNSCKNLKYVELPSYLERGAYLGYYDYTYSADGSERLYDNYRHYGYRYNFQNCTALEKVVMRAATPPTIDEDPFNNARAKSDVTLVVPSFAVVNYKLDTYWYQFGNIVEGDDVDYWKITSPLMLTNNRRMQGKPDVDLYYGGQLTVGGNAPMTMGQFNMYVNESNPGRLLNTCDDMTADNAKTHFTVEANKWFFFTPIHDVNVADIQVSNDASYVFRYYDAQNRATNGASGSWKNVDTDKLLAGQGYIFHCNTACDITFPADVDGKSQLFRTGDVSRTLAVNEATTTANRSWNYIGNPYPCYYDIYYMDFTAPITVWTGSTYKAYSVADDEFALRPMQSFFVQKPDAVDVIIFHKEGRQLTTDITHNAAARTRAGAVANRHLFNIAIENGEQQDVTRVVINSEASMSYEVERDAAKFMSMDASVPQLLTLDSEGNNYAINERPIGNGQVRLAYYAGKDGFYTIRALRADGEVSLYDAELNKTVDITSEDYTFQSDVTDGVNSSRFTLTFKVGGTTGIDATMEDSENVNNDVYNLSGQRVAQPTKGLYIQNGKKVVRK